MLTNPLCIACSRRVHIGGTYIASLLRTWPFVDTSSGAPVALSSSTAAGRVVFPVRKHGLVKMQPREPNQNSWSFEPGAVSPDGAPHNDRADHRALAIDDDSNANARASMRFRPD